MIIRSVMNAFARVQALIEKRGDCTPCMEVIIVLTRYFNKEPHEAQPRKVPKEGLRDAVREVIDLAGGCDVTPRIVGYGPGRNGKLCRDKSIKIIVDVPIDNSFVDQVKALKHRWEHRFDQEWIRIKLNGPVWVLGGPRNRKDITLPQAEAAVPDHQPT